jgi:N-methylhydantoinase A/oxoprolinase/acetone carboxylase beta subunit
VFVPEVATRVHVIACGVLAIDLKDIAIRCDIDLSMEFLPGGLHARPRELRQRLQEAIDRASSDGRGDMIAIGYGVCGMGAVGIHARNVPLAIPRVSDCIALFLGSDAAYREQFAKYPGTYYLSAGWVEEKAQPQCGEEDKTVCGDQTLEFRQLVDKHGRENAEAIRYFLSSWQRNYQRAAFIDTGAPGKTRLYAELAAEMARKCGWIYEKLVGGQTLLEKLLKASASSDEILIVPPHHVTAYDAVRKSLAAVPVREAAGPSSGYEQVLLFEEGDGDRDGPGNGEKPVRLGLGIDAGGTYTDTVIYDFDVSKVLQKAKALTTKYDYTIGIDAALDHLDAGMLAKVDLVCISTTLATNAIVEGKGQNVGLLLMPPYGRFYPQDITHQPLAVVDGKMEIDGHEIAPIDPGQIRLAVREMVDKHHVAALAVVGYASHVNPAHELAIADIIREEFGLSVTCGQDVSEGANYIIRATTAILNARIIPYLESLLAQVQVSLARRKIEVPVMVVRSDGSLMNVRTARQRPIETILSGPAASAAGASFLAGIGDAVIVDIGGTTTDTATIVQGAVRTCEEGATVGGHRTHVRALDIRTRGLGGDSLIVWERGTLRIGPRRVGPVCWLAEQNPIAVAALEWIGRHLDFFGTSTRGMDLLMLTGQGTAGELSDKQQIILKILAGRPMCVQELARLMGDTVAWEFLPLEQLEENHLVGRCGLTPTDLLHVTGEVKLWDAAASRAVAEHFARLLNMSVEDFTRRALDQVVRDLTVEIIRKQLDEQGVTQDVEESPAAIAMVNNLLDGGSAGYKVGIELRRPLVGIGAPVQYFLPKAAQLLQTRTIIPPDADVANAIGAITSCVCIQKRVTICPADGGGFGIEGLPAAPKFGNFEDAHAHALAELVNLVRAHGVWQGTSASRVEVLVRDRIATVADGSELFIGRTLDARLVGRPDLARLAREN